MCNARWLSRRSGNDFIYNIIRYRITHTVVSSAAASAAPHGISAGIVRRAGGHACIIDSTIRTPVRLPRPGARCVCCTLFHVHALLYVINTL